MSWACGAYGWGDCGV